jgi:ABC-type uncharacterized transport system, periplasmic component
MRRREFITLIGSAAAVSLLLVPVARAQEPGRIYRLGVIAGPARQAPRIVAFFDELKGLGFVEGHNLQIVAVALVFGRISLRKSRRRWPSPPRTLSFAADDHAIRAIQEAIHTVPIVAMAADMVALGYVRSLGRPGGNTTGVSFLAPELDGKRQEILMEAVPGARRIAVLADPLSPNRRTSRHFRTPPVRAVSRSQSFQPERPN